MKLLLLCAALLCALAQIKSQEASVAEPEIDWESMTEEERLAAFQNLDWEQQKDLIRQVEGYLATLTPEERIALWDSLSQDVKDYMWVMYQKYLNEKYTEEQRLEFFKSLSLKDKIALIEEVKYYVSTLSPEARVAWFNNLSVIEKNMVLRGLCKEVLKMSEEERTQFWEQDLAQIERDTLNSTDSRDLEWFAHCMELKKLQDQWDTLSSSERIEAFKNLNSEQQGLVLELIQEYMASLSPDDRRAFWNELSQEEKDLLFVAIQEFWNKWTTPEERIEFFRSLSLKDKIALIEEVKYYVSTLSPEARVAWFKNLSVLEKNIVLRGLCKEALKMSEEERTQFWEQDLADVERDAIQNSTNLDWYTNCMELKTLQDQWDTLSSPERIEKLKNLNSEQQGLVLELIQEYMASLSSEERKDFWNGLSQKEKDYFFVAIQEFWNEWTTAEERIQFFNELSDEDRALVINEIGYYLSTLSEEARGRWWNNLDEEEQNLVVKYACNKALQMTSEELEAWWGELSATEQAAFEKLRNSGLREVQNCENKFVLRSIYDDFLDEIGWQSMTEEERLAAFENPDWEQQKDLIQQVESFLATLTAEERIALWDSLSQDVKDYMWAMYQRYLKEEYTKEERLEFFNSLSKDDQVLVLKEMGYYLSTLTEDARRTWWNNLEEEEQNLIAEFGLQAMYDAFSDMSVDQIIQFFESMPADFKEYLNEYLSRLDDVTVRHMVRDFLTTRSEEEVLELRKEMCRVFSQIEQGMRRNISQGFNAAGRQENWSIPTCSELKNMNAI